MAFIMALSNYLVSFKFEVFGTPFAMSAFTIPLVYVMTDLITRLLGKEEARNVAILSLFPGMIASFFIILGHAPFEVAIRIALASGTSHVVSNLIDIYVFQYFRNKYNQWYIAPSTSGILVTIFSTYFFFALAFINSTNTFMADNWYIVATNQILVKIVCGMAIILPVYKIFLDYITRKINETTTQQQLG
jgi:hypothetical protein